MSAYLLSNDSFPILTISQLPVTKCLHLTAIISDLNQLNKFLIIWLYLEPLPIGHFSMMQQDYSLQDTKVSMAVLFELFSSLSSSVTEDETPQDEWGLVGCTLLAPSISQWSLSSSNILWSFLPSVLCTCSPFMNALLSFSMFSWHQSVTPYRNTPSFPVTPVSFSEESSPHLQKLKCRCLFNVCALGPVSRSNSNVMVFPKQEYLPLLLKVHSLLGSGGTHL